MTSRHTKTLQAKWILNYLDARQAQWKQVLDVRFSWTRLGTRTPPTNNHHNLFSTDVVAVEAWRAAHSACLEGIAGGWVLDREIVKAARGSPNRWAPLAACL